MSPFFESIRFQNGEFSLLDYHEDRLNRTRREVLGLKNTLKLSSILKEVPDTDELYKCKVSYGDQIDEVIFTPYKPALQRAVRLVEVNKYQYSYKSSDREFIQNQVAMSGCDDIIMLKNGFLTDASYSNLALFDGEKWVTPATYLLPGVKRRFLLDQTFLKPENIHVDDLKNYSKLTFINAMRDFELVYRFEIKENSTLITSLL